MNKIDELGVLQMAEDIEAGNLNAEVAFDVILEKYSDLRTMAFILDVLNTNGYYSVIEKFIIAKHNKMLRLNECRDYLEACLEL